MPTLSLRAVGLLGAAGLIVAGCAAVGEPTRHYVMDAVEQKGGVRHVSAQEGPLIAVMPVTLPEYLNQHGIVTRSPNNEITRAEFHIWAGPLSEMIAQAVAENIGAMLSTDRVTLSPNRRAIPVDYSVDIEIVQFERLESGNTVDLVARWIVFRGDERGVLAMRRSRIHRPAAGPEYRDTVAAMGDAIAVLSEEIAATIAQGRDKRRLDRWAAERMPRAPSGDAAGARRR